MMLYSENQFRNLIVVLFKGVTLSFFKTRFTLKFLLFFFSNYSVIFALENCKWDNRDGTPCLTINKTPNTSEFNQGSVNKIIITKQDIINSGAII